VLGCSERWILGEAMSSFTEVVLITAVFSPGMYIYLLLDRMIKDRESEIVTGIVRGVAVSTVYRRFSLYTYWAAAVIVRVGYTFVSIIAFLVMAENVDDEGAKLVAYMFAFFSAIGLLGAMALAVMGYIHCVSALRQAEAD
jgi:hypothetical protein